MFTYDYKKIITKAWHDYGDSRKIKEIKNISVEVSTNGVYLIQLDDSNILFAKFSYYGKHEAFLNDHLIINTLANNLGLPFDRFLARSLVKGNQLYIYRYKNIDIDASLVFYLPVTVGDKPPKILSLDQISRLGSNIARFHKSCDNIRKTLPRSNKNIYDDLRDLKIQLLNGNKHLDPHADLIHKHIDTFVANSRMLRYKSFHKIPVFIDWNIGNFSVNDNFSLCSRWDFDWFRVDSRMLDFYFLARVCSSVGDRTEFSYGYDILKEERFLLFLKSYHQVFPLTTNELIFMKESYRFFLLNYVLLEGQRFFHEAYGTKLQDEAITYLENLDEGFDPSIYLDNLNL